MKKWNISKLFIPFSFCNKPSFSNKRRGKWKTSLSRKFENISIAEQSIEVSVMRMKLTGHLYSFIIEIQTNVTIQHNGSPVSVLINGDA